MQDLSIHDHMNQPQTGYAQEALETAFLQLLQNKPVARISVTELCRRAGVNRSTFYAHYLDIYDLQDKVCKRFIDEIFLGTVQNIGTPRQTDPFEITQAYTMRALQITLEHRDLCRLLIRPGSSLSSQLLDEVLRWCCGRYNQYAENGNALYLEEYTMAIGGSISLWIKWIQSDCNTDPEHLAIAMTRFIRNTIDPIWQ